MENATVLLIEDEDNDVFFMRRNIQKLALPISLQRAKDGEEAIEYLSGQGKFADRTLYPLPGLVLLDIKMPRRGGFEVLEWLRTQKELAQIPVVMVTSSKVESDVERSYQLGAQRYLVKPLAQDVLKQLLTATKEFLAHCDEEA